MELKGCEYDWKGDLYEQLGYNVILFEMRAHGGNKRVSNWAALQVCYDLEQVLQLFQNAVGCREDSLSTGIV